MYWSRFLHFFLILAVSYRLNVLCGTWFFWDCPKEKIKAHAHKSEENIVDRLELRLSGIRSESQEKIRKNFPSPHSELLGGILLGINDLNSVPTFNDVVRDVGTVHVIVVSGYNINLVFASVFRFIGSKFKFRNLLLSITATFFYAVISGFDPPVIRAWIMGAILILGTYYGRKIDVRQVLNFSAVLMILLSPALLFNMSFQLSFLAALGLISFSEPISLLFKNRSFPLITDLISTLAAQILVWPLLAYHFEKVSLISPLVNSVVLWLIPLSTILGGIFLAVAFMNNVAGLLFSYILIVPLDLFIKICTFFSAFPYGGITYKPSYNAVLMYYIIMISLPYLTRNRNEIKKLY